MSSLKKMIETIEKFKKLFNFLITELIGDEIANNKDLSNLIDSIIRSDPTLVSDIKKYIFDANLSFLKTALKIFGRAKQIDIFNIISNLPNPDKAFSMLENLHFKEINMASVTMKIMKYASTQIGGSKIEVDPKIIAISVAVPVILLTIGKITEFILAELQKKKENEIKLNELKDQYDRNKKIKDAETELKVKSILSNGSATSGGNYNRWFHYCY